MLQLKLHPRTGKPLLPVGYLPSGRAVWPILGGDGTDPLTRINELAARLSDLTDDELTELRTLLETEVSAQAEVDPSTLDDAALDNLSALAQTAEAVAAEATTREQAVADRAARRDEALSRARAAIPAQEPAPAADTDTGDASAADSSADADAVPEPVAASARPTPVPLSQVRQTRRPDREPQFNGDANGRRSATLVAAGTGERITNDDAGIELLTQRLNQAVDYCKRQPVEVQARAIVAAATLPSEHQLQAGLTPERNRREMDRAIEAQRRRSPNGLVASGGVCRPVDVDYDVPTWTNVEQPAKAALPTIGAPRGGLQYMNPVPYDATVYGPGVAVWSEANDRNPGGANTGPNSNPTGTGPTVKPCIEIDCTGTTTVMVEAITQCAQISNFRGRFSPENVEVLMANLEQAFAAASEVERITQMRAAAKHVTVAQAFGASRDLLNFFDRLRAYYRSVYRLSDNVALEVWLNSYVREVVRIDLRKAAFPYEGDTGNSLFVNDAQVDAWFASIGLTPVWVLDDDTGDQTFAKAGAGTLGSPATFPWFPVVGHGSPPATSVNIRALAFPSGSYQRLDGGELNLGVVRDSALNAVNKYQVFSESFEAVAFRGFEAIDFQGNFIPNGATAGTISPA